jgi:hypothetical protein
MSPRTRTRRRPPAAGILAAAAIAALTPTAVAQGAPGRAADEIRMNQVQVIGTHNSYKRSVSEAEQAKYDELLQRPGAYDASLAYDHASIPNQLARQGVRGLELDLFPDPEGGLYAQPILRTQLGLGPLADPAWTRPGIKTFHVADLDYATTCVAFVTCLQQVKAFSDATPRHVPLLIMLELKSSEPRVVEAGGVAAPPWEAAALDALDAEIRSVFGEADLITPDDRAPAGPHARAVRARGGLADARPQPRQGGVPPGQRARPIRDAYTAGRPSLEGPRPVHELPAGPAGRGVHQAQRAARDEHGRDPGPRARRLPRAHALGPAARDGPLRRHDAARGGAGQRRPARLDGLPRGGDERPVRQRLRRRAARRRVARCNPVNAPRAAATGAWSRPGRRARAQRAARRRAATAR